MKYLVDANVLGEPTKANPGARVLGWLRRHERKVAVDPIVLGELRYGILILPPRKNRAGALVRPGRPAASLPTVGANTGFEWAALVAGVRAKGKAMPVKDT